MIGPIDQLEKETIHVNLEPNKIRKYFYGTLN
jgi:hypothetical protein